MLKTLRISLLFFSFILVSESPYIAAINIRGPILMGTALFIDRVINLEAKNAKAIIIYLDTPGGDLLSTQKIIQTFLNSKIPIISYVSPAGATAASAGLFILISANIAAMAPGTSTGAATPVPSTGGDLGKDMRNKVVEITSTIGRALSEERGRNIEWVKKAVEEAKAATAQEALELKIIDVIANSEADLFEKIEGKEISLAGKKVTISELKNLPIKTFEMNLKEQILEVLSNPTVAMLIATIGTVGIIIELYNPGLIVPGALGVICLVISLVINRTVTISFGAGLLILTGLIMVIIDIFLNSFILVSLGALAILGGLFYLINPDVPPFEVSVQLSSLIPVVLVLGIILVWVIQGVIRSLKLNYPSGGKEALLDLTCSALTDFEDGKGKVFLNGSYWQARLKNPAQRVNKNAILKVVGTEGLTLIVEKVEDN